MTKRGTFDYILLETTGLANPGNIAPLFWLDSGLGSSIYLDGVVTLVDAKNILRSLDEEDSVLGDSFVEGGANLGGAAGPAVVDSLASFSWDRGVSTAQLQVSHADVVVVNKSDLVTEKELATVLQRVKAINGLARVHVTTRSRVEKLEGLLLDLHAYDEASPMDLKDVGGQRHGHSHIDEVSPPPPKI